MKRTQKLNETAIEKRKREIARRRAMQALDAAFVTSLLATRSQVERDAIDSVMQRRVDCSQY